MKRTLLIVVIALSFFTLSCAKKDESAPRVVPTPSPVPSSPSLKNPDPFVVSIPKHKKNSVYVSHADLEASRIQMIQLSQLYLYSLTGLRSLSKALHSKSTARVFPSPLYAHWLRRIEYSKFRSIDHARFMIEDLERYWKAKGLQESWLRAHRNSYFILVIDTLLKRYHATLWRNKQQYSSFKDKDVKTAYVKILNAVLMQAPDVKRLVGDASAFLDKHGRDSTRYKKLAHYLQTFSDRELYHLRLELMIQEKGYDAKVVKTLRKGVASGSELREWDRVLGKWTYENKEKRPHHYYSTDLHYALSLHEDALKKYLSLVRSRGFIENYFEDGVIRSGIAFLDKIIETEPNKVTNAKKIKDAWKEIVKAREKARKMGAPNMIMNALLRREYKVNKKSGELLDEDRSEVKWAYGGAVAAPLLVIAAEAAVVAGLAMGITSSATSIGIFVGLPLAVGTAKGMAHFIYYGLRDDRQFTSKSFFNNLIPQLCYALPAAITGPIIKVGSIRLLSSVSPLVSYKTLIAGGVYKGVQAVKGYQQIQDGKVDKGSILIIDSMIDILGSLALVPQDRKLRALNPVQP